MKLWFTLAVVLAQWPFSVQAASCFYINSYHQGYEWSDRIQATFSKEAAKLCTISYHFLDAKRVTNRTLLKNKGMEIANLIALSQPDVVIAADDAASEYVVNPYLRNGRTPVVYVGINWDPRPFGYPMDNATGMTELWPIQQAIDIAENTTGKINKLAFISYDGELERRDETEIRNIAAQNNIEVMSYFAQDFDAWKQAILNAQSCDAIKLGTNQGIKGWNKAEAIAWLKAHNKRYTFANQDFMLPYAMFSISKSPEEFGHWAAELTESILQGNQPWQIPIVPNHIFIPRYNPDLLNNTPYKLPDSILRKAVVYREGGAS